MSDESFLSVNGYALSIRDATASTEITSVGKLDRSAKGKAFDYRRGERLCIDATVRVQDYTIVDSIDHLLNGEGHTTAFECGLDMSTGLQPEVGYDNLTYNPSTQQLTVAPNGTISYDASLIEECWSVIFHHDSCQFTATGDGIYYLNGLQQDDDSAFPLTISVSAAGLVTLTNNGLTDIALDELAILPWVAHPAVVLPWLNHGMPSLPCVDISGKVVHCEGFETIAAYPEVKSSSFIQVALGNGYRCNARDLKIRLCEDRPFYYKDSDDLQDHNEPEDITEACPPTDMRFRYPLNNDASETEQGADGSFVGTVTSSTLYYAIGGESVCLDTTDDYIDLGTDIATEFSGKTDITVNFWFYKDGNPAASKTGKLLKLIDATGDTMVDISLDDTGVLSVLTPSAGVGDVETGVLADGWYNINAYTSTATGVTILTLNDTSVFSHLGAVSGFFGDGVGVAGSSCIGVATDVSNDPALGYYNELLIFDHALRASEVTCLFDQGTPTSPALDTSELLYWFDASQEAGDDGDPLTAITNLGTGSIATAGGTGTLRRATWVCRDAFELNGTSDSFAFGPDAALDSENLSFFFVGRPADKTGFQVGFRNNYSGGGGVTNPERTHGIYTSSSGVTTIVELQGVSPTSSTASAGDVKTETAVWQIQTLAAGDSFISSYRDEGDLAQVIDMDPSGHVEMTIGENTAGLGGGLFWEGTISEFRVYDNPDGTLDHAAVLSELQTKWLTMPDAPTDMDHHFPLNSDATDAVGGITSIGYDPGRSVAAVDGNGYQLTDNSTAGTIQIASGLMTSLLGETNFDIGFWYRTDTPAPGSFRTYFRMVDSNLDSRITITQNFSDKSWRIITDLDDNAVNDCDVQTTYGGYEDGVFHFVHVQFDLPGNSVKVFIDGQEKPLTVTTLSLPASFTSGTHAAGETWIGHPTVAGDVPGAVVDDYKIWKRNLEPCEIEAEYNRMRPVIDTVAHHMPLDVDGDDVVGSATATLNGMTFTPCLIGNGADHDATLGRVIQWTNDIVSTYLGQPHLSFSGWIRASTPVVGTNNTLWIMYWTGASVQMANLQVVAGTGQLSFVLRSNSAGSFFNAQTVAGGFDDGDLHHIYVSATLREDVIDIYVDGEKQAVTYPSGTPAFPDTVFQAGPGAAGTDTAFTSTSNFNFQGCLDEYRWHDTPLTPGQVQELFEKRS